MLAQKGFILYWIAGGQNDALERRSKAPGREVRCYCNLPDCVSQGYLCRGSGCFTELPQPVGLKHPPNQQLINGRSEHAAVYSGCLDDGSVDRLCLRGRMCCEQDLCNHVDSPAVRARLNRTLQGNAPMTLLYCTQCTRVVCFGDKFYFRK